LGSSCLVGSAGQQRGEAPGQQRADDAAQGAGGDGCGQRADELLLGVKGDKTHQNPEIALAELESLALDSEEKLFARMKDFTGRTAIAREYAAEPDITTQKFGQPPVQGLNM